MDFWGDRHRGTSEHANRFNIDAQDDCPVRSGQGRLYIETSILFTLYKHVIRVEILLNLEMEAKTFGCHWKVQVSCNHPTGSWFEVVVCLSLVQMIRNKVRRARMIFLLFAIMFGQIVVCLQAATHCFSSWREVSFRVSVFLKLLDGFRRQEAVAAITHFSLDLRDPAKTFLEFLDIFSFHVERLRISCFVKLGQVDRGTDRSKVDEGRRGLSAVRTFELKPVGADRKSVV